MRALVISLALLVGLALTAAVAWNAAEAHDQSCVMAAQALPDDRGIDAEVQRLHGNDSHSNEVYKRLQGCARLP